MNKNLIKFMVVLTIFMFSVSLSAEVFFKFLVNLSTAFWFASLLQLIFGLGLIFLVTMSIKILLNMKIPLYPVQHNKRKYRNYKEERATWRFFLLLSWILVLSVGTVAIYLSLNLGFRLSPYSHILIGYYDLALPGAIGALWGAGMTEVFHYSSLTRYGKDHLSNIDMTKDLTTSKDWYKKLNTYEENLQIFKKRVIDFTAIFSLTFFVLLPEFQIFFDKLPPI